jgi:hypothetical protein
MVGGLHQRPSFVKNPLFYYETSKEVSLNLSKLLSCNFCEQQFKLGFEPGYFFAE